MRLRISPRASLEAKHHEDRSRRAGVQALTRLRLGLTPLTLRLFVLNADEVLANGPQSQRINADALALAATFPSSSFPKFESYRALGVYGIANRGNGSDMIVSIESMN